MLITIVLIFNSCACYLVEKCIPAVKMYLIECDDDASLCIVQDNEVICDESVQIGDVVQFIYEKKYYEGTIIMQSDNMTSLRERAKNLRKKSKNKIQNNENLTPLNTRTRIKRKMCSSNEFKTDKESPNEEKSKNLKKKCTKSSAKSKESKIAQQSVSKFVKKNQCLIKSKFLPINISSEDTSSEEEENSSLEDQKHKDYLYNKQQDIDALKDITNCKSKNLQTATKENTLNVTNKSLSGKLSINKTTNQVPKEGLIKYENNDEDLSNDSIKSSTENPKVIDEDYEEEYDPVAAAAIHLTETDQLYGKDWPHKPMVLLINGIYCRKKIWVSAFGSSKEVTHLARRLIVGVFKEEELLKCTFTGQAPRAQGKERQKEEVHCLDVKAKNAIIDYAILIGTSKNWKVPNRRIIERSMTQQLGR